VPSNSEIQNLASRIPVMRCRDVILAALQSAFSLPDLADGGNPFRFNRDDPQMSPVWISTPGGAVMSERDGGRALINVTRGEYSPNEIGLHNAAGGSFSAGTSVQKDLGVTMIQIMCTAGNEVLSETLAHYCYAILKMFRHDIVAEYAIHNIRMLGISAPVQESGAAGSPWMTTVMVRVEIQENNFIQTLGNRLNRVEFMANVHDTLQTLGAVDYPAPFPNDPHVPALAP